MGAGLTIILCCAVAGCGSHSGPNATEPVEIMTIADHFTWCVSPELKIKMIGASTCPSGWRAGAVCDLRDGKREFVEDSRAALDSCEKRGGTLDTTSS